MKFESEFYLYLTIVLGDEIFSDYKVFSRTLLIEPSPNPVLSKKFENVSFKALFY